MTFISEDSDRNRLPVALLSGFLGSGKTTLLNALLRDPKLADTAVAINEFGEVPLDQHLIDHGDDKTVVMANGCLCCNLAGDMEDALMRIFTRRGNGELPSFARLVVEPSGLADPAPIAQAILRNPLMSRVLRLDTTLVTVDSLFGLRQIAEHEEVRKQIALADRILLTKTDVAETPVIAALEAELAHLNPNAPILHVQNGNVDPSLLFAGQFLDTLRGPSAIPEWIEQYNRQAPSGTATDRHVGHEHDEGIKATSIVCAEPLDWRAFETWLRTIRLSFSDDLLRLKGIVNRGDSARPLVVHGIHHVLHMPVELDHWPSDDRRSRLVFITRGRDAEIRNSWGRARPAIMLPAQRN
jgi:G3E family GTPase